MKRAVILAIGLALLISTQPSGASHNADIHSDNVKLVTTWDDGGAYRSGSDIAFWKNRAVFGNLTPGGFRVMNIKKPKNISEIGQFTCVGTQSDVSIWKDLVFVSVDQTLASDACNADPASQQQFTQGTHWEGIRIVSIADPANPQQIKTVVTDCGSHTHTLVPDTDNKRLLLYVQSYPLGAPGAKCNANSHRKISIIEVPLADPTAARVIATPSVSPAIGCHDVTYFPQRDLAGAACISESQLWDVSDPANPKILSHIENPEINIHHSVGFAWDGNTMVLGDELGGAAVAPGCNDQGDSPLGSLWFYNVKDPKNPEEISSYKIPQQTSSDLCTAHNFNIVPLRKHRDILISAWYEGGTTVVDFTNPEAPAQIAHYTPKTGNKAVTWSSYWYNGRIYVNNYQHNSISRGIDVFQIKHGFVKRSIDLPYLNPQTQLPFKIPKKNKR